MNQELLWVFVSMVVCSAAFGYSLGSWLTMRRCDRIVGSLIQAVADLKRELAGVDEQREWSADDDSWRGEPDDDES